MVEGVLVDTDLLIEYVRGRLKLPETVWYVSEVTLYEFIRGTRDPAEAKELIEESFVVLFHDNDVLSRAAAIWRKLKSQGALVEDRDLLIGALAISKSLPLLTGNKGHFSKLREFGLRFYGEEK